MRGKIRSISLKNKKEDEQRKRKGGGCRHQGERVTEAGGALVSKALNNETGTEDKLKSLRSGKAYILRLIEASVSITTITWEARR